MVRSEGPDPEWPSDLAADPDGRPDRGDDDGARCGDDAGLRGLAENAGRLSDIDEADIDVILFAGGFGSCSDAARENYFDCEPADGNQLWGVDGAAGAGPVRRANGRGCLAVSG